MVASAMVANPMTVLTMCSSSGYKWSVILWFFCPMIAIPIPMVFSPLLVGTLIPSPMAVNPILLSQPLCSLSYFVIFPFAVSHPLQVALSSLYFFLFVPFIFSPSFTFNVNIPFLSLFLPTFSVLFSFFYLSFFFLYLLPPSFLPIFLLIYSILHSSLTVSPFSTSKAHQARHAALTNLS